MVVEPFDGITMLITCAPHYPYDNLRVLPRRIGYYFAEVVMIGVFKLIFYDYIAPGDILFGKNVNSKIADIGFSFFKGDVNSNCFAK